MVEPITEKEQGLSGNESISSQTHHLKVPRNCRQIHIRADLSQIVIINLSVSLHRTHITHYDRSRIIVATFTRIFIHFDRHCS